MIRPCAVVALACFVLTLAALDPAPAIAKDHVLAWDDSAKTSHRSSAGTGHVIEFAAPKGKWWVKAVRIHGARYGGGYDPATTPFTVAVGNATTEATYALFKPGKFEWVEVQLEEPVAVERAFRVCVAFSPTRTKGVFMGIATTANSHSSFGLPGGTVRPAGKDVEWMLRAVLTDEAPKAGDRIELAHDDGEMKGKRADGHAIEYRKPSGTWWIHSVRIFGHRYGEGYDPASLPIRVTVAKSDQTSIHQETTTHAKFGTEPGWVTVKLTGAVKAPSKFRIFVAGRSTKQRGVNVGYSAAKRTNSYTGPPDSKLTRFTKGAWMIRVVLTKVKPDLPEPTPPQGMAAAWLDDLAFLEKTVAIRYPALAKKGVDWKAVVAEWRPRFRDAADMKEHMLNVHRLLATLGDSHTGVTSSTAGEHVPSFDGLYGAGMWIAVEDDRLVLRALLPGHPLASKLPPGSELIRIDGRDAAKVHEELRARLRTWHGWSSTHFLDARLSFQFFPFGAKQTISAQFKTPSGKVAAVTLPRWGPGGRGLSRAAVTMPESIPISGAVASGTLDEGIGYLRILGGMSEKTRGAFFDALNRIEGVKGIVLDCRGMGGGGDYAAWAMAGRFFRTLTPHGHVSLKPTGRWQFGGPVVMLIDERMISSAETFTWAMTETGRVITVGRPTGGATIIPTSFEAPSGTFRFRMGVTDRKTPGKGVQPEGKGTPPDVYVPYNARTLADGADPAMVAARAVLDALLSGASREKAVGAGKGALD